MNTDQLQACIAACDACAAACDQCAAGCLTDAEVHRLTRCIALSVDNAQLCRLTAGVVARRSDSITAVCMLCEDLCDACAEECERHSMEYCQRCAQACRRCALECLKVSSAAPLEAARRRYGATRGSRSA